MYRHSIEHARFMRDVSLLEHLLEKLQQDLLSIQGQHYELMQLAGLFGAWKRWRFLEKHKKSLADAEHRVVFVVNIITQYRRIQRSMDCGAYGRACDILHCIKRDFHSYPTLFDDCNSGDLHLKGIAGKADDLICAISNRIGKREPEQRMNISDELNCECGE